MEVYRPLRLLTRATIMEKEQGPWIMVSDLYYADFDVPFPDSLFAVQPPEGATPIAEAEAEPLWYERSLTTRAAIYPSALLTTTLTENYTIELVTPPTEHAEGNNPVCYGGICEYTGYNQPVLDVFRWISMYPVRVDDPVLQRQTVSLSMDYRDGLSRERRLAGLCELLGVTAVMSPPRDTLQVETTFEQDGRPLPVSTASDPEWPRFEVLEGNRVHISSRCVRLEQFVGHVWGHSEQTPGGGYMVKRPADPDAYDPFEALINVDYIASRNWAENAAWLAEHLGVTYRTEQRAMRTRHIQVSPGLPTPDGSSPFSHYAAGELEDCYPNPASPTTTIPFTLKAPAHVVLRIFSGSGQLVRTLPLGQLDQARHEVQWDGQDQDGQPVADGTYLYRLEVDAIATSAKTVNLAR